MLQLMEHAIKTGLARNETDYFQQISFAPTNVSNIRRGHQAFTKDHILNACRLTGANANWIFGLEKNMMRKESKNPIEKLSELTIELEALLSPKKILKKPINNIVNKKQHIKQKSKKSA